MEAARELDKVLKASGNDMIKALQQSAGFRIDGGTKYIDFDLKRLEYMLQIQNEADYSSVGRSSRIEEAEAVLEEDP